MQHFVNAITFLMFHFNMQPILHSSQSITVNADLADLVI